MGVETGGTTFGQLFLAEGGNFSCNIGGFTVGQFTSFDIQATGDTGGDWVSQGILDAYIGMQSPPTSNSSDGKELSYQLSIHNTGADGYFQIMWLTIT